MEFVWVVVAVLMGAFVGYVIGSESCCIPDGLTEGGHWRDCPRHPRSS